MDMNRTITVRNLDKKNNRYDKHISIIFIILVLQLCIPQISTHFFLQFNKVKYRNSLHNQFYEKGKYIPLSVENSPQKYEFVIVRNEDNILEEKYFTTDGEKIAVIYENKKWKFSSSSLAWSKVLQEIFLGSGIVLVFVRLFHKMSRTGRDSMWRLMDYPDDNFEKLCLIYGFSIFIGNVVFAIISSYLSNLLFSG
jgi:hypothetical protein